MASENLMLLEGLSNDQKKRMSDYIDQFGVGGADISEEEQQAITPTGLDQGVNPQLINLERRFVDKDKTLYDEQVQAARVDTEGGNVPTGTGQLSFGIPGGGVGDVDAVSQGASSEALSEIGSSVMGRGLMSGLMGALGAGALGVTGIGGLASAAMAAGFPLAVITAILSAAEHGIAANAANTIGAEIGAANVPGAPIGVSDSMSAAAQGMSNADISVTSAQSTDPLGTESMIGQLSDTATFSNPELSTMSNQAADELGMNTQDPTTAELAANEANNMGILGQLGILGSDISQGFSDLSNITSAELAQALAKSFTNPQSVAVGSNVGAGGAGTSSEGGSQGALGMDTGSVTGESGSGTMGVSGGMGSK